MSHQTSRETNEDILPEYDFSQGIRGKHHRAYRAGTNVAFLDADVARAFTDSASVNQALRLLVNLARQRVPLGRPRPKKRLSSARHPKKPARARG
jgi:hypothetical protein